MKQGKDINTLAAEIVRQASVKKDYVVPVGALNMLDNATLAIGTAGVSGLPIKTPAHRQLGEYVQIPTDFYDRLRSNHPRLLAQNVNTLLQAKKAGEKRLTRTLDGNVRAFLSDSYRPLDNVDLMMNLMPHIMERRDIMWASAEVTESRLYIKLISTELEGEVRQGDVVRMGLIIQNSEIGAGSLVVAPFSERLMCTNGMTHISLGQRKAHIGKALTGQEVSMEYFADETRQADDRAFFLKARDTVNAALDGRVLAKVLEDMREAATDRIEGAKVMETMEAVAVQVGLDASEKAAALEHLISGADLSRWGVANAITRTAADATSYDRASELEKIGGDLIHGTRLVDLKPVPVKVRARRTQNTRTALAV